MAFERTAQDPELNQPQPQQQGCSTSLASIITSLYPHQHGITGYDPKFTYKGEGPRDREDWLRQRLTLKKEFIDNFYPNSSLGFRS